MCVVAVGASVLLVADGVGSIAGCVGDLGGWLLQVANDFAMACAVVGGCVGRSVQVRCWYRSDVHVVPRCCCDV